MKKGKRGKKKRQGIEDSLGEIMRKENSIKRLLLTVLTAILTVSVMSGCRVVINEDAETGNVSDEPIVFSNSTVNYKLKDNKSLYENDDDNSVITMYLTVTKGNSSEATDHTWEEVNTYSVYYYEEKGVERYGVNGLLQVGDESGPKAGELGYGKQAPNCTVTIRGQSSSSYGQKNYKIKLKNNSEGWNGQMVINLNKHQGEGLRFRNKLMYDLQENLNDMVALRTQFVHLYVRDLTQGEDIGFEDYGLYTQVEQANKNFLKAHGLDREGFLYKLNNIFEFYNYDALKLASDPDYDEDDFTYYLKTKGDKDNSKLLKMIEDVNDSKLSGGEILKRWFDEDNVATWLAFNILLGSVDTQSRNTLLYSPLNVDKWFFINWDCDDSMNNYEREIRDLSAGEGWECGISNYWGNVFFRKILKDDGFREVLDKKMNELRELITEDKIRKMANEYAKVVKPYVFSGRDLLGEPLTEEEYDDVLEKFPEELDENYKAYLESLKKPMPFFIGKPALTDAGISFIWDPSYDFQSEDIYYDVTLADNYELKNPIFSKNDIYMNSVTYNKKLPEGQYFLNVKAKDTSGNEQYAFDYYVSSESIKYFGTICFYVDSKGNVKIEGE